MKISMATSEIPEWKPGIRKVFIVKFLEDKPKHCKRRAKVSADITARLFSVTCDKFSSICSLYVTICSLYIHCMFTICSLYIHYIFTIYAMMNM